MPFKPVPGQKAEGYIWQADYSLHTKKGKYNQWKYISATNWSVHGTRNWIFVHQLE